VLERGQPALDEPERGYTDLHRGLCVITEVSKIKPLDDVRV